MCQLQWSVCEGMYLSWTIMTSGSKLAGIRSTKYTLVRAIRQNMLPRHAVEAPCTNLIFARTAKPAFVRVVYHVL
jgi:hypothetical protein